MKIINVKKKESMLLKQLMMYFIMIKYFCTNLYLHVCVCVFFTYIYIYLFIYKYI